MSKNISLLIRIILFLAGAGIILFAFFSFNGNKELTRTDIFIWASIGVMYLVFFLPFFFTVIRTRNFSEKIPVLSIVWLAIVLYIAASIGVILVLTQSDVITVDMAFIIQAVFLFFFATGFYFAYIASGRVRSVAAEEQQKQENLNIIKPKAQNLLLLVNNLSPEYEKAQKILRQSIEDIRYTYPANSGGELELQILRSLDKIAEICGHIRAGAHSTALETEAGNLQMIVKERKLLRN